MKREKLISRWERVFVEVPTKLLLVSLVLPVLLAGCANSAIKAADKSIAQEEWLKAVLQYRKVRHKYVGDVEFRSRLKQAELKAADQHYQRGEKAIGQGNINAAIVEFQQGLVAMPEHSKLLQAMRSALIHKEANDLYAQAARYEKAGKLEAAIQHYSKALAVYPEHRDANIAQERLQKQKQQETEHGLALSSQSPITLGFRQTSLRTAFEFIAKSFGINIIFDESVQDVPVTLFAKSVTFEQALNLMLTTSKTFYKRIGPNTILIAPDNKDKRGQYEDHVVRLFNLNTIKAKDMVGILNGIVTIKKIIINEQLNTLLIRDTRNVIRQVERLIAINDRKPAEMILDVEILEVNRSKAERLGLDLGYEISTSFDAVPISPIADIVTGGTITLPATTFRFFKQDVDAKTLANPKIRVIHGKPAKIHIGDRVPLRSSTIQDSTGQVRTAFTYTEIGIKLNVEPDIHLDNSATVKIGLEVSTLGQNLGTPEEPAFGIGTRNADTYMLLRDGETAILGGLIRDEERNNRVRVPGIGDIPVVGSLFTNKDDSSGRTDVLLTITPRVVRSWELPAKSSREFYSGTADSYSDKPPFAYLAKASTAIDGKPVINLIGGQAGDSDKATVDTGKDTPVLAALPSQSESLFTFSRPLYEVTGKQDFTIELIGENIHGRASGPIEVLFNPQLLEFVRSEPGDIGKGSPEVETDPAKGVIRIGIDIDGKGESGKPVSLVKLILRGKERGISYLVYRVPSLKNANGEETGAQVRASRVVVK